eukprot:COSAG01_NODE_51552_length_354_cov_0.580392_1_plen_98_part_10
MLTAATRCDYESQNCLIACSPQVRRRHKPRLGPYGYPSVARALLSTALQTAIDKEKLLRNQLCPAERHLLIFTPAVVMELFRNDKSDSKISISEQCQA